MPTVDTLARPLRSLRLSVTDRCNLRCRYCMPDREYTWLPRRDLLDFDELARLVGRFCDAGVRRLRLTGGEPLLRADLPVLVAALARESRLDDLAMTTNGVLLAEHGAALRRAGLRRVTVSVDSLRRDRFVELTGRDDLARALAGIDRACALGFDEVKLNTVVIRGVNDDELADLVEFGGERGVEVRFIEYMDVGGATGWNREHVVSHAEILAALSRRFGAAEPIAGRGSAPAERFRFRGGRVVGIVASTTRPFCGGCDRARLTADGMWFTCLYAAAGINLRDAMRGGASDAELVETIARRWRGRDDRTAEQRSMLARRSPLAGRPELLGNPHLEMHTRGG